MDILFWDNLEYLAFSFSHHMITNFQVFASSIANIIDSEYSGKECKEFNQEDAGEAFVGTRLEQLNKIIHNQRNCTLHKLSIPH